ncbi:MAG: hypothetical protein ACK2T3_06170, partial [Candidatus Promineifilaceae bacterium]
DHLKAVDRHLARLSSKEHDWVDLVIANDNLSIPTDQGGGRTTYVRPEGLPDVPLATFDLVDEMRPWRHDSSKLAQAIASIAL